ncbi:hypothetical protein HZC00_02460 [Candidatus Kaiserbacteria bacterium]|nr:hypothetical protein [Candidatus Kaiserbacteria bacterium]
MSHTHRKSNRTDSTHGKAIWVVAGGVCTGLICLVFIYLLGYPRLPALEYRSSEAWAMDDTVAVVKAPALPPLDKVAYGAKMLALANYPAPVGTSTASTTPRRLWPADAAYPGAGAILPFKRIVAYYGNFYSKGMGVLGEYPREEMLAKLRGEVAKWEAADSSTPVMPAIEYIDVTAQESPGKDGKYRLRMPDDQIDYALDLAHEVGGIVILDVQVGKSTLQAELPLLEKYLSMPQVHLALDPEFSMKTGARPGTVIGSFDAADFNYAANYLAEIVREHNLPPKILIVHRFTQPMVTHARDITPLPEVQIVVVMDGWGSPERKIGTYNAFINTEPVQFTGFKLFYKNDLRPPSTRLLTPRELLDLTPQPIFIQYQ